MGWARRGLLAGVVAVSGCYSGIDDVRGAGGLSAGPADGGGGGTEDPDGPFDHDADGESGGEPDEDACEAPAAGPPILVRLTREEYDNTVADLLGTPLRLAEGFADDGLVDGFRSNAVLGVTRLMVEDYQAAAETLAADAVQERLPQLVPCGELDAGCDATVVGSLGRRFFRRPLTPEEHDALLALMAQGDGFADRVRRLLVALMQAPDFLYRVERAVAEPESGRLRLDRWSLATRLSFLLWNTTPDDELLDVAAAGLLDDAAGLEAEARRMLLDPRGAAVVADFHRQWLDVERVTQLAKDPAVFPAATPSLAQAMAVETAAFADEVVRRGEGTLRELLTASWSVVDPELAALYGVAYDPAAPPVAGAPAGFVRAELPVGQRAGALTHASVMATHAMPNRTSPVLRGLFVRERLLCTTLPDPPPDVPPPPTVDPDVPVREQFEQHTADPACAGCHSLIDDLGFGLEHYDGLGAFRFTEPSGIPIDATASLTATDVDGEFEGAVELAERLADSRQVQDCAVTQWFRYAAGRPSTSADGCALAELQTEFDATGGDIVELLVAIVTHDSFAYVAPPEDG